MLFFNKEKMLWYKRNETPLDMHLLENNEFSDALLKIMTTMQRCVPELRSHMYLI